MKAQMSLEYIIKFLILLVVAAVVIGMLFSFSSDIKTKIRDMFGKEKEIKTTSIEADSFSTAQIKTYMNSCWEKTGERYNKDFICYILKGDVSGVTKEDLKNSVDGAEVVVDDFDPTKKVTIIRFVDVGDKIVVES